MEKCSASPVPIQKEDKLNLAPCPRNDMEQNKWKKFCMHHLLLHLKAGFVVCFEATIQANWLQNFISGLGIVDSIARLLKMYCDNSVAIFCKNDKYSKGDKHMELKYFVVKEEVQKQRVSMEHISTNLMIVDPLNKGLLPKTLKNMLKVWELLLLMIIKCNLSYAFSDTLRSIMICF